MFESLHEMSERGTLKSLIDYKIFVGKYQTYQDIFVVSFSRTECCRGSVDTKSLG
jgi:hypothetical protein